MLAACGHQSALVKTKRHSKSATAGSFRATNFVRSVAMSATTTVEVLTPAQRFQQLLQREETAATMAIQQAPGVTILGPVDGPEQAKILSVEAQKFVAILHRCFNNRRKELLARRVTRQYEIDAGVGLGRSRLSHLDAPHVLNAYVLVRSGTSRNKANALYDDCRSQQQNRRSCSSCTRKAFSLFSEACS